MEQLDAACKRAAQTSEFLPVVATIRRCYEEICASSHENVFLGPPMTHYPTGATPEEREEAMKFSEAMKGQLGLPVSPSPPRGKKLAIISTRSPEEQKRVLDQQRNDLKKH